MHNKVLVCDNGTGYLKVGYAEDTTCFTCPSVFGKPMLKSLSAAGLSTSITGRLPSILLGQQALDNAALLDISYPIENGIIRDYESMIPLWEFAFSQAHKDNPSAYDPKNSKIILTEAASNPAKNREKTAQIFFEQFNFSDLYISVQAVLTLYSKGLLSGLVVDSGEGVTSIVPVFDGYSLSHLVKRLDIAGRDITRNLSNFIFQKGYASSKVISMDIVRQIKEKLCYVAVDLDLERKLAKETAVLMESFTLPDGKKVHIGEERFEAPEILFQPHLVGKETGGLADLIFDTIQGADLDLRPTLYNNIILSGGSTTFPGIADRISRELESLYLERIMKGNKDARAQSKIEINVCAPEDRSMSVYGGACVLGSLMKDQKDFWISKSEWEEQGTACLAKLGPR